MRLTKVEELANCDIQILSERFGKISLGAVLVIPTTILQP
jgi:hypothetical protein